MHQPRESNPFSSFVSDFGFSTIINYILVLLFIFGSFGLAYTHIALVVYEVIVFPCCNWNKVDMNVHNLRVSQRKKKGKLLRKIGSYEINIKGN